ncbi:MAG: T9SS type A sorting domain-containing protein, partial [Candidatus Kapaibacterium sp.]
SENHFADLTFVSHPNNIVEIIGLNKVFKNPEVYIYDIRGRLVKRFDRLNSDRLDLNSIDIGRGIYFIKSGYSIGKLIKY